jgi:hypothetical protein
MNRVKNLKQKGSGQVGSGRGKGKEEEGGVKTRHKPLMETWRAAHLKPR